MKDNTFLTCCHLVVLWLLFRWTLQKGVESIEAVSSKYTSPDYRETTTSLIYITVALDALAFVRDWAARQLVEAAGDGRSTLIRRQPCDGQLLFFLFVARRSSLLTVSSLFVLGLLLGMSVNDSSFCANSSSKMCLCLDHHWLSVLQSSGAHPQQIKPFSIFSL